MKRPEIDSTGRPLASSWRRGGLGASLLRAAVLTLTLGACASEPQGDARSVATSSTRSDDPREAAAKPGDAPPSVTLVEVKARELARSVIATGTLGADDQVTVSTKVPGRLASISVDLGSKVQRNQPIAQIEVADYQLRVEQAESALSQARALVGVSPDGDDEAVDVDQAHAVKAATATLEEARGNLERARALVDQKLVARADFDAANAAFLRAQTSLDDAREQVRSRQATLRLRRSELMLARQQRTDATIRAPLDGLVQARHASAGEYVSVGSPIATIVRVNPLRLRVEVPERDAASVHVGQMVRVSVDENGASYEGHVARIAPTISEQSRTLVIEAEIVNPGNLKPGSFARAEISINGQGKVVAVPPSAIVTFAGIEKVIAVEHGKAVEKPITTGLRTGAFIEVTGGLVAGDWIVLAPGNLQEGQPVSVSREP